MPNEILQSMQQFSQFLSQENLRAEKELKEKKVNLSGQRIARAFEQLGPGATAEDLRKLSFQMVDDAAGLDALQENQSLINSMYNTTLNTLDRAKQEKQDQVYLDSLTPLARGQNIQGMGAENASKFVKTYLDEDYTHEQLEGFQTYGVRKDMYGKVLDKYLIKDKQQDFQLEVRMEGIKQNLRDRSERLDYKPTGYTVPGAGGMQVPLYTTKQGGHFVVNPQTNEMMPVGADYFSKMGTEKGPESVKTQLETIELGKDKIATDLLTKLKVTPKKGESSNQALQKLLASKEAGGQNWMSEDLGKTMVTAGATAEDWQQLKDWKILQDQQEALTKGYRPGLDYANVREQRKSLITDTQYDNVFFAIDQALKNPTGINPFGAAYEQDGKPVKYKNSAFARSFKELVENEANDLKSRPTVKASLQFKFPQKKWKDMTNSEWANWFDSQSEATKSQLIIKFQDVLPSSIKNYEKKPK